MSEQEAQEPSKCYTALRALLAAPGDNGTKYKQSTAAAFIVGAGQAAREAVPALHKLGLAPIFILHYDSGEMYNLLNDFLHIDLQGLRTPGMAQRELDDLAEKKIQVIVGVSTISSDPPTSPREEYVYKISELLLQQPYQASVSSEEGHLHLPSKRCLADMHNGTDALYMRKEAEDNGWSVSAIESSAVDDSGSGNGKATGAEDAYWWQFKRNAAAVEA